MRKRAHSSTDITHVNRAACSFLTFRFADEANLDEGAMWPTDFALKELTATEEAKFAALVKKAVS
jgi:hypothetical protein